LFESCPAWYRSLLLTLTGRTPLARVSAHTCSKGLPMRIDFRLILCLLSALLLAAPAAAGGKSQRNGAVSTQANLRDDDSGTSSGKSKKSKKPKKSEKSKHSPKSRHGTVICHVPPGDPASATTIRVGGNAAYAHLANHPDDQRGRCPAHERRCDDGIDNDFDGQTDCSDTDCARAPACQVCEPEICDDGIDNDRDQLVDCQDNQCVGEMGPDGEICEQPEESCDDGFDNDGDSRIDCNDVDCFAAPECDGVQLEECTDGLDNDFDRLVDCQDPECIGESGGGGICERREANCDDAFDNDGDARVDCNDADCFGDPACDGPELEICHDRIDNDFDTLVDCQDPECLGQLGSPRGGVCELREMSCDDAFDNDGDRKPDCADPDCASDPACGVSIP
jgi:hypothetical protein